MNTKKRGLDKGLDALLGTNAIARTKEQAIDDLPSPVLPVVENELKKLPVEWLYPGKYQPRKDMATIGWIIPWALIDAANSSSATVAMSLRG